MIGDRCQLLSETCLVTFSRCCAVCSEPTCNSPIHSLSRVALYATG